MSLQVSRSRVMTCLKDLNARWHNISTDWDDAMSHKFRLEYVDPLERKARAAVGAMEHMHEVVSRARRECG